MSLNTSHANGGVLIFSGERWNLQFVDCRYSYAVQGIVWKLPDLRRRVARFPTTKYGRFLSVGPSKPRSASAHLLM